MVDSANGGHSDSRLEKLKQAYAERLASEFEKLAEINEHLAEGSMSHKALDELHAALHTMAGAAGTFGFHKLGETAREFEQQVSSIASQEKEQAQIPVDWLTTLRAAHDADKDGVKQSPDSTQYNIIEGAPVIWLVERDKMLAGYVQSQLSSFGFEVHCLNDANGLEKQKLPAPDLLLIDHHAIEIENSDADFAVVWKAALKNFQCPIFFTGAEESFNARLQALRAGGQGYFLKPLDMARLAPKITYLIRSEDTEPERVVIIEDDRQLAGHFQSLLETAGMKVSALEHPAQLFECISELNPELVLMDVWLSGVTGAELAALLAQTERWAHLPVIYLSGESDAELRNQALLRGGDAFLEKPVDTELLVRLCRARIRKFRELEHTRNRDSLTGLLKHGSIKDALQVQWQLAQRRSQTFTVVMLDIDHFKAVNDTHGHAVGDQVLASIGTLLKQHFRTTDKLGRYGGEEFTLVLPDCDNHQAAQLVDRLREDFAAIKFSSEDQAFSCTLSAGIADNRLFSTDAAEALLARADAALYEAKNNGRNRVVTATGKSA